MTEITDLLDDGETLVTAIIALSVVVTGFFLARRWIKKV